MTAVQLYFKPKDDITYSGWVFFLPLNTISRLRNALASIIQPLEFALLGSEPMLLGLERYT